MNSPNSQFFRKFSLVFWCLGLAIVSVDFFSVPLMLWKVSIGYIFFILSGLFVIAAEKKEFSLRIALYRIHDILIYGPWKYLLLYFLWVTIFAFFTKDPKVSLLFVSNGWVSLFFVGIGAQLIFCERGMNGAILLPSSLSIAFKFYACALFTFLSINLLQLVAPNILIKVFVGQQLNLFLYFTIGFPFLIWDFAKVRRRMLPAWLSGVISFLGLVTIFLMGRLMFKLALIVVLGLLLAFFIYKKIKLRRNLYFIFLFGLISVFVTSYFISTYWAEKVLYWQFEFSEKMNGQIGLAIENLWSTKGLGLGMGLSTQKGIGKILAEGGVVGLILYSGFFANIIRDLFRLRRSQNIVVSNIALLSVLIFLLFAVHFVENPYGAYIWVWYALWAVFASTFKKKKI